MNRLVELIQGLLSLEVFLFIFYFLSVGSVDIYWFAFNLCWKDVIGFGICRRV